MDKDPSIPRRNKVNWHYARDDPMFTTINVISRNEDNTDMITRLILPVTIPKEKKEKKLGKGKQKAKELETISEAVMTEAEQLKTITKRSRKETHNSHASGSGADEGTSVSPGVPDAPDYDSDDVISWKSSEDDQADDKNDNDENAQDDANDDKNDDDENVQDDDDEAQTESEDDDDEDSANEIEGVDVEGEKSDEDATDEEDQGNETDKDTNASLEGRNDVMTDVILPQASSSNMLNPNQIQYDRIREEAQAENQQFLDSIDEGMKKEAKTSYAVAANLSELELKKILIDKMEAKQLYQQVRHSKQLYKGIIDCHDDQEPSVGTDQGSKEGRSGKEPEFTSTPRETTTMTAGKTTTGSKTHKQSASQSAPVEETMQSTDVFEAPTHQEFETGIHDEQAEEEVHHLPDWFQQPKRLPSPDHAWNKSVPAVHESVQPWLSNLARRQDPRESFDELTDTTFDFSAFVMNRLNVKTLTPELLVGQTFELMKGTCKSLTELEYFCEEVYKATTEKLDWINPEGRQYPHDLRKPLLLVPNSQGRHVIPFHHFINNDLEYLRGGESSRKYSTSGILHWGKKRRQFYAIATTRESAHDVYSKRRIIAVTKVEIVEWQNYKHLDWITVRRDDDILYKFKEGDFHRLRIQDIEDMLLLLVQGKVTNLNVEERIAFNVSLRMFTRSVVIQRRVEDLQLGVESYQKKLNLTKPDTYRSNLRRRDAYTPYSDPRGFIYENKDKKNRLMRIDELHKMEYLPQTFWSQRDKVNARAMIQAIDKRLKTRRIMRSLERFVGGRPYGEHAEYDESNTYVLERFNTTAGNPVKKILLKLNLSDHRLFKDGGGVKEFQRSFRHSDTERLSRSDEVLKLKNFKKDATLKLFKSTNQERYEHVGPEVTSYTRWQDSLRWRRDCAWLMISRCSRSQCQIQVQGTSSIQKSMITTTYSQENVKRTS
ncbi:hypothetical protein Tco_0154051 [Tanacetum coccineum]